MRDLIYVPIEPLAERYSEQWYRCMPQAFNAAGYENVYVIEGVPLLNNEIKVGTFLDINSTTHYKWSQLQTIARKFHEGSIKRGTVFFFADIEFWGIESIRLLADMNGIDVCLTGFLHAASYTREDAFAIAADYQRYTEVGWIAALDKVFVGSSYHKRAVVERRLKPLNAQHLAERIVVTKNPVFIDEYPLHKCQKQKKVLLTNRFDPEKRPRETLLMFRELKAEFSDWEFVVTTGRPDLRGDLTDVAIARHLESEGTITIKDGLTKDQYHRELAEAHMVVTHSIEENYGYCIAEALIYGCLPLMRRGLSHDEFVINSTHTEAFLFDYSTSMPPKFIYHEDVADVAAARILMRAYDECSIPAPKLDMSGMGRIINELPSP